MKQRRTASGALVTLALLCCSCARSPSTPADAATDELFVGDGDARDAGEPATDAAIDGPSETALRLISPLSTSRVTGARPTVRWTGGDGADHVEIQVCSERSCSVAPATVDCPAVGSCTLTSITAPGPYFWRGRAVYASGRDAAWTPTWELVSMARGAPVSASVGLILDVDGDARADPMYASGDPFVAERLWIRYGADLDAGASIPVDDPAGIYNSGFAAGDLDGDGIGDLIVGQRVSFDGPRFHNFWTWYPGSTTGISSPPAARFEPPGLAQSAQRGVPAFGAGDLNGDGFGDVVAGAIGSPDDPAAPGGCIFVYLGGLTGPSYSSRDCFVDGGLESKWFGSNVASGGDVNGDGFADVVVDSGMGEVHLRQYLGGASGLGPPRDIVVTGYSPGPADTSLVGDVDGDGYADVAVPAVAGSGPTADAVVFVFLGSPSGLASLPDATLRYLRFGMTLNGPVSGLGDLDGDGFDDIGMANGGGRDAPPPGGATTGIVVVFSGSASGLSPTATATLVGPDGRNGRFGDGLSGPGDADGDGRDDLVVSAPAAFAGSATEPADHAGRVYLFRGPVLGAPTPAATWSGSPETFAGLWLGRAR